MHDGDLKSMVVYHFVSGGKSRMFIDINADVGESFGQYRIGNDEALLKQITSANIACGYHAGDHHVMHKTVQLAVGNRVAIGAHPGLPDLMGFGRRAMAVAKEDVFNMVVYQVGALQAFARLYGQEVAHVKPHGALYNMAATDMVIAEAIASAVKNIDSGLILFGLSGSALVEAGRDAGLGVAEEVFADRTYQPDGTLTPRSRPDAVIHDIGAAVSQAVRMVKEGTVIATDGSIVPIKADTICIHGDEPQAPAFAQQLRYQLANHGILVRKLGG